MSLYFNFLIFLWRTILARFDNNFFIVQISVFILTVRTKYPFTVPLFDHRECQYQNIYMQVFSCSLSNMHGMLMFQFFPIMIQDSNNLDWVLRLCSETSHNFVPHFQDFRGDSIPPVFHFELYNLFFPISILNPYPGIFIIIHLQILYNTGSSILWEL